MATCTAQLIFGRKDRDHGGIYPFFKISLYENNRSSLVLSREPINDESGERIGYWIPTPDNTLKDCMLMAAAYILKDESVNMLLDEARKKMNLKQGEMLELHNIENLDKIYETSKAAFKASKLKVVVLMLHNSSMETCVRDILNYDVDLEVCRSVYLREYSEWTQKIEIIGEI